MSSFHVFNRFKSAYITLEIEYENHIRLLWVLVGFLYNVLLIRNISKLYFEYDFINQYKNQFKITIISELYSTFAS